MKLEHLENLKVGDVIEYKIDKSEDFKIGYIKALCKCANLKNGLCVSCYLSPEYVDKKCIGKIEIYDDNGRYSNTRCGVENGWSIKDSIMEEFLTEEEMMIE